MKKSLSLILFSLLLIIFCPFVLIGCGEVTFDDIPYGVSEADATEVVNNFNNAGKTMVTDYNLKLELETTNTYTFYDSDTSNTRPRVVKDIIKTSLGNENTGIAIIKTTRYEDGVKKTENTSYYVRTELEGYSAAVWYCYTNFEDYVTLEDEILIDKERTEYITTNQIMLNFYNSTIFPISLEEVANIYEKVFDEQVYYKLTTGVTSLVEGISGLDSVNDRFEEDKALFKNPQLFKIISKDNKDAVENFYYECALDATTNYVKYFVLNYDLTNIEREKYLNVSSTTRLVRYGENVTLNKPDDVNEYTAYSFMKTMQSQTSYITYFTEPEFDEDGEEVLSRPRYSVAKIGQNYSVIKEDILEGTTTYYYAITDENGDYYLYEVREDLTEVKLVDFDLDLLNFSFDLDFSAKIEDKNSYQFGDSSAYTNITFNNEDVYSIDTYYGANASNNLTLYIDSYGSDYSILSTRFVSSIEGFSVVRSFSDEG